MIEICICEHSKVDHESTGTVRDHGPSREGSKCNGKIRGKPHMNEKGDIVERSLSCSCRTFQGSPFVMASA